jgi:molybdate transport system regulatory protein
MLANCHKNITKNGESWWHIHKDGPILFKKILFVAGMSFLSAWRSLTKRYIVSNIECLEVPGMARRKISEDKIPEFGVKHGKRFGHEPESGIVVRSKVWLEKDGKLLMGWGRATLLERIDQLGSISAAARSMKLAYRNAWLWVEAINHLTPRPLVEKVTGGTRGGRARLTEEGRRIVNEYKAKRASVREILNKKTS